MAHSDPRAAVLAIVVHDALNGPAATDDPRLATLQAAVHAWMEGHVEGEGHAGVAGAVTERPDGEMPSPPFPDPHNPELARIIAEAHERLGMSQQQLGVTTRTPADWCGPFYQNANRLAHVYWLRSLGVRAWLVHVLLTDDPHGPTSAAAWEAALTKADEELGLSGLAVAAAGRVFLPAGSRDELLA